MIAILAAMQVECEYLLSHTQNKKEHELFGRTFTTGTLCGHQVVIGELSIGKVNAALTCQQVVDAFSPRIIFHTGIAGGLKKELGVQAVIIGESLTYHDFDPEIMRKFFPYVDMFHSDPALVQFAESALTEEDLPYHKGLIVTGDKFIASNQEVEDILSCHPALAADMESAAIACCCYIAKIPLLVIRSVSDFADDDAKETYEENKKFSADVGAKVIIHILEKLNK